MRRGWQRLRALLAKELRQHAVLLLALALWLGVQAAALLSAVPLAAPLPLRLPLAAFATVALAALVVLGDAPARRDAFWKTRPVPWLELLAVKSALIVGPVVAAAAVQAAVLARHGVGHPLAAMAESVLVQGALVGVAVGIAAVVSDVARFLVGLAAAMVATAVALFLLPGPLGWRLALLLGLVALAGFAVWAVHFAGRDRRRTAIAAAGCLVLILTVKTWPGETFESMDRGARHALAETALPMAVRDPGMRLTDAAWHASGDRLVLRADAVLEARPSAVIYEVLAITVRSRDPKVGWARRFRPAPTLIGGRTDAVDEALRDAGLPIVGRGIEASSRRSLGPIVLLGLGTAGPRPPGLDGPRAVGKGELEADLELAAWRFEAVPWRGPASSDSGGWRSGWSWAVAGIGRGQRVELIERAHTRIAGLEPGLIRVGSPRPPEPMLYDPGSGRVLVPRVEGMTVDLEPVVLLHPWLVTRRTTLVPIGEVTDLEAFRPVTFRCRYLGRFDLSAPLEAPSPDDLTVDRSTAPGPRPAAAGSPG